MSISATSSRPKTPESLMGNLALASGLPKADTGSEESLQSFSTTDGSVVAFKSGASAVRAGSGIFVGGYFVGGVTESAPADNSMPFIRY